MKVSLKIGSFQMELEQEDEQAALSLLSNIVGFLQRFGVEEGGNKLADLLQKNYEGQPGWTITETDK